MNLQLTFLEQVLMSVELYVMIAIRKWGLEHE